MPGVSAVTELPKDRALALPTVKFCANWACAAEQVTKLTQTRNRRMFIIIFIMVDSRLAAFTLNRIQPILWVISSGCKVQMNKNQRFSVTDRFQPRVFNGLHEMSIFHTATRTLNQPKSNTTNKNNRIYHWHRMCLCNDA
tara:strand:- start:131108 stop:131527 length:420 start_codon:yes stop_codon:yes gene_type:complete